MTKKQSSSERTAHEERHHCPAARDQGTPEELHALAEDELRALVRTLQSECELLRAEQDRLTNDLQSLTEQHELLEQGADGFLQKPFSFAELSRKVAELVAR